jgi:hypothetical protein
MKSKLWVAAVLGLLATSLSATVAAAQCTPLPAETGVMIKFDGNAWAYESNYTAATCVSAPGSQLTVVGIVSKFCNPFGDLNPADPNTEYTFVWDNLVSLGTGTVVLGSTRRYTTQYTGGNFRIYAGSPRNAPVSTPPALPAGGVVPDAFMDGTMILSGQMDTLNLFVSRISGIYSGSFRTNYVCNGGTRYDEIGNVMSGLLSGLWCPVPPVTPAPVGTCSLPAGWSAHPNGKWDLPATVAARPSTWGKIKSMYR